MFNRFDSVQKVRLATFQRFQSSNRSRDISPPLKNFPNEASQEAKGERQSEQAWSTVGFDRECSNRPYLPNSCCTWRVRLKSVKSDGLAVSLVLVCSAMRLISICTSGSVSQSVGLTVSMIAS